METHVKKETPSPDKHSISKHAKQMSNSGSHSSWYTSSRTSYSSLSSVITRKRAKAEAAKARLFFAEQEAMLKKKQALIDQQCILETAKAQRQRTEMEADLQLLIKKREAAAAEAEAIALNIAEGPSDGTFSDIVSSNQPQDPQERTKAYVENIPTAAASMDNVNLESDFNCVNEQSVDVANVTCTSNVQSGNTSVPHVTPFTYSGNPGLYSAAPMIYSSSPYEHVPSQGVYSGNLDMPPCVSVIQSGHIYAPPATCTPMINPDNIDTAVAPPSVHSDSGNIDIPPVAPIAHSGSGDLDAPMVYTGNINSPLASPLIHTGKMHVPLVPIVHSSNLDMPPTFHVTHSDNVPVPPAASIMHSGKLVFPPVAPMLYTSTSSVPPDPSMIHRGKFVMPQVAPMFCTSTSLIPPAAPIFLTGSQGVPPTLIMQSDKEAPHIEHTGNPTVPQLNPSNQFGGYVSTIGSPIMSATHYVPPGELPPHGVSGISQTCTPLQTMPNPSQNMNMPPANFLNSSTSLNPSAPMFRPANSNAVKSFPDINRHSAPSMQASHDVASDFTRFLLRKDLLLSRLTTFNDKAESYRTWKASFDAVMKELSVSPTEEIDLLLKWSGSESHKHVLSIKSANTKDPVKALQRIWERLEERYGCAEMIEASLKRRIENFPKLSVKDNKKLYDLSDLLAEIESIKEDDKFRALFGHYDSSTGITPIVNKLPTSLQQKWTSSAVKYMKHHSVVYPTFSYFCAFIREQSQIRNNPCFEYNVSSATLPQQQTDNRFTKRNQHKPSLVASHKTDTKDVASTKCPLHKTSHSLNECRGFRNKSIEERRKFVKDNDICFKCCESSSHSRRDCKAKIKCSVCDSDKHPTALHADYKEPNSNEKNSLSTRNHGGESKPHDSNSTSVNSSCTEICGDRFNGKSCSKIVLVQVYPKDKPHDAVRLYAMIDDQSNKCLATSEFFDLFSANGKETDYILSSCAGKVRTKGRRVNGLVIESFDSVTLLDLPTIIECNNLPDNREEIPTPIVAQSYPHLHDIRAYLPQLDKDAKILMLIGRDLISAHHVLDQRIGPLNTPYAQKLSLGWTIIGETCLGRTHKPDHVNVRKTHVLKNSRSSIFPPCPNDFRVQDPICDSNRSSFRPTPLVMQEHDKLGSNVFIKTKDDEKLGLSIEDKKFLNLMDTNFEKDTDGNWVAPLPFRESRPRLESNRAQALRRAKTLDASLRRDPVKRRHFFEFMEKLFANQHAELAAPLDEGEEHWFLPIFGVYHPKKPDQIRAVFDSSAQHNGLSLNNVLLTGPDLTNSLLGVLIRFRREPVAVMCDIQQMFHCFRVRQDHKKYLRFFWYENNDFENALVEYNMNVHVFGNSPSPAVATYGLRRTVKQDGVDSDVIEFVEKDFYVDDGLTSVPTVSQAVDLVKRTQDVLQREGNLRLHKIASNYDEVMHSFPSEDLAKDIKGLDLGTDILPVQRSLGVGWDLESDSFLFNVSSELQPYTRRGILSTINSIFDPLGFLAPVVLEGKLLLRLLINGTVDWDEPLPLEHLTDWNRWRVSLSDLRDLAIPRTYLSGSFSSTNERSIHIFSDASESAIAAVAYVRSVDPNGKFQLGFILGKAKVAPVHSNSIPRLELCAAVLAVEIAETISEHLNLDLEDFKFYSDSKVVLGYIHNESRRFYTYVTHRVERIRKSTKPTQWTFVPTDKNPADKATRCVSASNIPQTEWLQGPSFLMKPQSQSEEEFKLQYPDEDKEVRQISSMKSEIDDTVLGTHRFERFSNWRTLIESVARLKHVARSFSNDSNESPCKGWHSCTATKVPDLFNDAQRTVIKAVQLETFCKELECIKKAKPFPKDSAISSLNPIIDNHGILRVGGRLAHSDLNANERNPIIVPGRNHISTLIVRHYHEEVKHQGRHLTEGAIRSAGFWITRGKRLISSVIHKCVKCRRLRCNFSTQKMADLPSDRLEPGPPFSNVGVDCFGPWEVVSRRTRGGSAKSKRWAVLFTCLTTRGIHIEVVEEMSSSSFINALKRFISIRGPVKLFRSDRGTNFVGATDQIGINAVNVESNTVQHFLYNNGTTWLFNPPHASHMGGVWERLIGVTKRILNSLLMNIPGSGLTHEMLTTFLAEVSAIVNSRPLTPVSSDPEDPFPLSPSTILTQKPSAIVESSYSDDRKNMYQSQWKRVQSLADTFWSRWRSQYLQTLQGRRKWKDPQRNFSIDDVVLMRDSQTPRNMWPLAIVNNVFPGQDGMVRKVEVRVVKDGRVSKFVRPVTELVLLLPEDS